MPITVPAQVDHTGPQFRTFYLVEAQWPSGTVYYSSREQMNVTVPSTKTFLASGIDVRRRRTNASGYLEYEVIFPAISATTTILLNDDYQGKSILIYEGAGVARTDLAHVVLLLNGIMGAFSWEGDICRLICKSECFQDKFSPPFTYDVFDFVPKNGKVISLQGNETNI